MDYVRRGLIGYRMDLDICVLGDSEMGVARSDVQVETSEVRVTEWRLLPGAATGRHIHWCR